MSDLWSNLIRGGGTLASLGIGIANYRDQKRNYERMHELQLQAWQREDTAVQRRVTDLKAAGLSPTLAAGSAAAATAPVQQHAPQRDIHPMEALQAISAMAHQDMDIRRGDAQISLSQAEERAIELQNLRGIFEMQWESAFNELNYDRLRTGLDFDQRTLEDRVMAITKENELRDKANVQADLDRQMSELNIKHQEIENILNRMRIEEMDNRLTEQDLEIAAKAIAVDQARADREWRRKYNLPSFVSNAVNDGVWVGDLVGNTLNESEPVNMFRRISNTLTSAAENAKSRIRAFSERMAHNFMAYGPFSRR